MGMMKLWDGYNDQYGPARSARPRVNRRVYPEGTMYSLGCPDTPQMGTWGNRLGDPLGCGPCVGLLALADSQSMGCCGCGVQCVDCPRRALGDSVGSSVAAIGTLGTVAAIGGIALFGMIIVPKIISMVIHSKRR